MSERIDATILNSGHCFSCRKCCKFDPDELEDAPMFTEAQFQRAEHEFGVGAIRFEKKGNLYKVVLSDIPGSEKKMCPFYKDSSGACGVFAYEVFDCYTWPFYLMKRGGQILITLSSDCPVVNSIPANSLVKYAQEKIGPRMLRIARQHPDLVTDYRENVIILWTVDEFPV